MGIPFILDERAYRLGIKCWIEMEYKMSPHVLTCGRTGSGKTISAKLILGRTISLADEALQPVELTVIDPKADTDFRTRVQ